MAIRELPSKLRRISRLLGRVCTAFGITLEAMLLRLESSSENHENNTIDPECSVRVLSRILFLIFTAFADLIRSNPEPSVGSSANEEKRNSTAIATYSILSLFRTITKCITNSTNFNEDGNVEPNNPRSMTLDSPRRLSRAFITHLFHHKTQADESKDPHQKKAYAELLEGTLSVLLTRAGSLLYTSTFSTSRGETIAAEIAVAATATGGPREDSAQHDTSNTTKSSAHNDSNGNDQRAAASESRSILSLLQLVLPAYQYQFRHESDSTASTVQGNRDISGGIHTHTPALTPARRAGSSLIAKPIDAIQNTLLKGIFGSSLSDSPFVSSCLGDWSNGDAANSARLTGRDGDDIMHNHIDDDRDEDDEVEDGEGADWFAREMWELVGWEILARGFESSNEEGKDGETDGADDDEELI